MQHHCGSMQKAAGGQWSHGQQETFSQPSPVKHLSHHPCKHWHRAACGWGSTAPSQILPIWAPCCALGEGRQAPGQLPSHRSIRFEFQPVTLVKCLKEEPNRIAFPKDEKSFISAFQVRTLMATSSSSEFKNRLLGLYSAVTLAR